MTQPLSEHLEQVYFVQWFRRKYSPVRIFAIPNGGWRSKATAMRLKSEGVCRGVPDLYVPEWKLWIEMKKETGGRVSPEQRDWQRYLTEECGDTWMVCHGCEMAQRQVDFFVDEVLYRG